LVIPTGITTVRQMIGEALRIQCCSTSSKHAVPSGEIVVTFATSWNASCSRHFKFLETYFNRVMVTLSGL
jgi:hypothetical protein